MTTVLAPPPVDDRTPADDEAAIGAYRRRLRRRLLLWSLPVVLIVLLVAAKLLSMPVFAALTQWSYADREFERSTSLSEPLGIANVIEPWVHHFDRGTGYAQIGVLDVARTEFATALELAPDDPTISCVIRTDLVLTIEAQGDAALLELRYADAEALFAQGRQAVDEAPEGCFQPPRTPPGPTRPNRSSRPTAASATSRTRRSRSRRAAILRRATTGSPARVEAPTARAEEGRPIPSTSCATRATGVSASSSRRTTGSGTTSRTRGVRRQALVRSAHKLGACPRVSPSSSSEPSVKIPPMRR
nr:hypothetical protein GCM10025699_49920 [Microbacterium flavescens]